LGDSPANRAVALTEGFQRGLLVAAGFSIVAALAAGLLLRRAERAAAAAAAVAPAAPAGGVTEIDLTDDRSVPVTSEV
ncbi:MAG TPA: hypothetical protein VGO78_07850, partial [Acidimicrobiales bacterium]|nr:hypothetical protein [Acidimicrobiales bacterium]